MRSCLNSLAGLFLQMYTPCLGFHGLLWMAKETSRRGDGSETLCSLEAVLGMREKPCWVVGELQQTVGVPGKPSLLFSPDAPSVSQIAMSTTPSHLHLLSFWTLLCVPLGFTLPQSSAWPTELAWGLWRHYRPSCQQDGVWPR